MLKTNLITYILTFDAALDKNYLNTKASENDFVLLFPTFCRAACVFYSLLLSSSSLRFLRWLSWGYGWARQAAPTRSERNTFCSTPPLSIYSSAFWCAHNFHTALPLFRVPLAIRYRRVHFQFNNGIMLHL